MFGASVSEVYNIIWCQFDLKIDNLILMIGKKKKRMVVYRKIIEVSKTKVECKCETNLP